MVTSQLQVECRTGKVCRPKTDFLPLSHATINKSRGYGGCHILGTGYLKSVLDSMTTINKIRQTRTQTRVWFSNVARSCACGLSPPVEIFTLYTGFWTSSQQRFLDTAAISNRKCRILIMCAKCTTIYITKINFWRSYQVFSTERLTDWLS